MNASENEMRLLLDAIASVRDEVGDLRRSVDTKLAVMAKAHAEEQAANTTRIQNLEKFRWQVAGALTLAGAMAGYLIR